MRLNTESPVCGSCSLRWVRSWEEQFPLCLITHFHHSVFPSDFLAIASHIATMDSRRNFDEDKALMIEDPCCHNARSSSNKKSGIHYHSILLLLNIIVACTTIYFVTNSSSCRLQLELPGWDTELRDARGSIEYEERAYTGALMYDYDKKQVVKLNDSHLEFFGPPSANIDDAWHYLLHGSSEKKSLRATIADICLRRISRHDKRRSGTIWFRTTTNSKRQQVPFRVRFPQSGTKPMDNTEPFQLTIHADRTCFITCTASTPYALS